VDLKKLDKKVIAAEDGADLTAELEDARLNAIFDRVYGRKMADQLDSITDLMKSAYNTTGSSSLKTFLNESDTNLQAIKKQFSDFNATSE
ncbi:MAG: hypothetical protein ABJA64_00545, partial [Candidatus Saccharibacteria bacterium]